MENQKKRIFISLPESILKKLELESVKRGLTKSNLIILALEEYLKNE